MKSSQPRTHIDLLALRQRLGLSQQAFWGRLSISQGGGSRYESAERGIPLPVAMLVELVYVKGLAPEQIEVWDMAILRHLKETRPDLYAILTRVVGGGATAAAKKS